MKSAGAGDGVEKREEVVDLSRCCVAVKPVGVGLLWHGTAWRCMYRTIYRGGICINCVNEEVMGWDGWMGWVDGWMDMNKCDAYGQSLNSSLSPFIHPVSHASSPLPARQQGRA